MASDPQKPNSQRPDQAQRIRAMLKRWASEDVSDEPDWEVAQLDRLTFSTRIESRHDSGNRTHRGVRRRGRV